MLKQKLLFPVLLGLLMAAPQSFACGAHFYINPDDLGFFGKAFVKVAGLAPPEKVFKIKHKAAMIVSEGEQGSLILSYDRPRFSKRARVQLDASKNIELSDEYYDLTELSGTINAGFPMQGTGMSMITVTVSGEHKGEFHSYRSQVYVRSKPAAAPAESNEDKLAVR